MGHTEETHVQSNTNSTTLPPIVMETDSHMTSHDPSLHTPEEGSVWKLRGSAANGEEEEVELTAAEETAKEEHKNMETLDLVADLIQRVNENQAELADMDSKALKEVHFELQRVSEIVKGVLEYSTNLVSEEGRLHLLILLIIRLQQYPLCGTGRVSPLVAMIICHAIGSNDILLFCFLFQWM